MHHFGEGVMAAKDKTKTNSSDRITISLAPGQRESLEAIARYNSATMSFVVRYALNEFLRRHENKQLPLMLVFHSFVLPDFSQIV